MKAVSNASPLIALAKAGLLHLLPALFERVVVPAGVVAEVEAGPSADPMRLALPNCDWLERVVLDPPVSILAAAHLGVGETEVIEWAKANPSYIAILDDRAARRVARTLDVPVIGTLGIIARAASSGAPGSFDEAISALRRAGLYLDEHVVRLARTGLKGRGRR